MEHRGTLGQQRGRIDPTGDHDYTRGKHGDNGWCWQQCGVIIGECMRDHFLSWCNSHTLACDSCCDYHSLHSWKSSEAYRSERSEAPSINLSERVGTISYQRMKTTRRYHMKTILALVCVLGICCASARADNKITYRDAQGRNMGSSSTGRSGKTSYRDAMGRKQGSSSTDRNGKTTYRDAMGRNQGSSSTDRNGKTTYRDAQGRNMGSSSTDRNGKTTYRDAQGRIKGTSTTDRHGKTTYRDAQGRIQGTMK